MGRSQTSQAPRGQTLVIVAVSMVVLVAMVGLVIDGGFLWGRQRGTQNGTDASAEAGAIQLARVLRGELSLADGATAVCAEVVSQAAANGISVEVAYYTDIAGNHLGTAIDESGNCQPIPACTPPACADNFASGVEVKGTSTERTFVMQIIGIDEVDISTRATAVSGYVLNPCEGLEACTLLPIAPPVTVTVCSKSNQPGTVDVDPQDGTPDLYQVKDPAELVTLPFCKTAAGSIGWLDWNNDGGGAQGIEDEIRNPIGSWPGPDWYQIAQTGDINSSQIQAAINDYTNQIVFIPMFDQFCPDNPSPDDCPNPEDAGGTNIWYHIPQIAAFLLLDPRDPDGTPPRSAWITGNDADIKAICGTVTDSGATSCLTGEFVDILTDGPVGATPPGPGGSTFYGVQLIK